MHELKRLAIFAAVLSLLIGAALSYRSQRHNLMMNSQGRYLRVLAYQGVFNHGVLDAFKDKYKVGVLLDTVVTPQQMAFHLKENPDEYDVLVPYLGQIKTLREADRLAILTPKRVPNLNLIAVDFQRDPQNPGQTWFASLLWGLEGLLINKDKLAQSPKSLKDLFANKALRKKIAWSNDPAEIRQLLQRRKLLESREDFEENLEGLKVVLRDLLAFVDLQSEPAIERLRSGQYWVMQTSNGRAAFAMQSKGNLDFILPEEGSTLWILGAVVPTRSLHLGWAESFVNFILNPQQVAQIVEASHQASPLAETWPGLPEMASANYLKKVPLARIKVDEGLEPMGLSSGELEKWLETLK